jgi:Transcription factor e(y)2
LCTLLYEHPEWWEEMRLTARETVQSKNGGVLDVSLDELSAELIETGEKAVPDEIREAIMEKLQAALRGMGTSTRR